jgi:recombination protein RecA
LAANQGMTKDEKRKIAMKVMDAINKTEGVIAVGFAKDMAKKLDFLPTPSEEINIMSGGGFPKGRITEIFGNNSSGKTSLCLETIGEDMQADPGSYWAWLESEESFDPDYSENVHDIDLDRLIYIDISEQGAEKSIDRLEVLMRSGILTGFVVNSVAGLVPKKELEENLEKANIALQARMMSKLMRKWTGLIGKKNLVAIFINQLRTDVNSRFGDPNVTTGGRALAFYSSLRFGMNNLKLQDSDPITADDGLKLNARIAKNRCVYDNPYKKCEFYVIYGVGVDKLTEIMDKGPEAGVLRKAGSWFYYEREDGELIEADQATVNGKVEKHVPLKFQGKTAFREFLTENPWFVDQLKQEIRGKAARGELIPTYQDEDELKEIAELNAIEKQIAVEEEKKAKKKKAKQDAQAKEMERSSQEEKPKKKKSSSKSKEEAQA